ncbi:TolC family protein [Bacteroides fragilis]|uniref:TolC family protein n=1 Tax=Bacteroides ovatus TaxID=28116 RepID=UPI001389C3C7
MSHFRAWLRTSNVAASGFGFGRDCNGFTDYRHFNQNPCNSILSLYLSAFHFFVVTLQTEVTRNYNILNEAELEVELTENAFSYAEENLQESSKSFETGMETLANFLEAQASWQKAYFEVISAKTNYHIAKSKYLNSIGGL